MTTNYVNALIPIINLIIIIVQDVQYKIVSSVMIESFLIIFIIDVLYVLILELKHSMVNANVHMEKYLIRMVFVLILIWVVKKLYTQLRTIKLIAPNVKQNS